jgi:hypothetical protein
MASRWPRETTKEKTRMKRFAAIVALGLMLVTLQSVSSAWPWRRAATYRTAPRIVYTQPAQQTTSAEPALPAEAPADQIPPQAGLTQGALDEIRRLGNAAIEIGPGHQGPDADFAQAMGPPPDDSHKWYITVLAKRDCIRCQKLLADFKHSDHLRAFVDVDDYTQSWAHYNVYWAEDATQNWRWKSIRIAAYPTVLVQPPLNRSYGDPHTVVMQAGGYRGDPAELAEMIRQAIRRYVSKVQSRRAGESGHQQAAPAEPKTLDAKQGPPQPDASIGYDPPFLVPAPPPAIPDNAPQGPFNIPLQITPKITPQINPNVVLDPAIWVLKTIVGAILALLSSGGITNLLLLVILLLLAMIRSVRKRKNLPLLIDDETYQKITEAIRAAFPSHRRF